LLQPEASCPLSEAYCRRTLDTDGLLAIHDAVEAWWVDDPAYDVFELEAYIGGKVVLDELYGTFCFAATERHDNPFTDADRILVRVMSKWMSYELERLQFHEELERTNQRLEQCQRRLPRPPEPTDGREGPPPTRP
jgi:GAF domain-containing protein